MTMIPVEPKFEDALPEIKEGMVIRLMWVNSYQHGATMKVTKVNRKTFEATEMERSYRPGTKWKVHKGTKFGIVHHDENGNLVRTDWYNNGLFDYSGSPLKGIC